MKQFILSINFLIISFCLLGQSYQIRMLAYDPNGITDTVYIKSNTDSLYRLVNGEYIFFKTQSVRQIVPAWQINGNISGAGIQSDSSASINNRILVNLQRLLDSLSNHITKIDGKQAAISQGTTAQYLKGNFTLGTYTGYSINVQALTSSPADGQTIYFGTLPKAPTSTANISKVYVRTAGTITAAEIYCYSGTAGTNESWSVYIRVNNTTDYLIQTLTLATSERIFTNSSLSISLAAGDYFEIKSINPTWATNPLTTIFGGYIKIN